METEMYAARRKQINEAISKLEALTNAAEEVYALVEATRDEENEAFENLSEGLKESERGQAIEQAANYLDEALSSLDEIVPAIENAIQILGDAAA